MRSALVLHRVSFSYDTSPQPLFHELSLQLPEGWTGVVGPNGSGKTTFLQLATGLVAPTLGSVRTPAPALYCPQRTDDPPEGLDRMLADDDPVTARLVAVLAMAPDWSERWDTLSHGERKRAQIGAALAGTPALLAVDEPTNHLDGDARERLRVALAAHRGVGILVSHDRELLDGLCRQCLFLEPRGVTLRPGGYTAGAEQRVQDQTASRERYLEARRRAQGLRREVARRRAEASQADRKRSKRHLDMHDSDGKEKLDRARVTGKDGQAGRLTRQLQGREERAVAEVSESWVPAERTLRFWLPGSPYRGDRVAALPPGALPLGGSRVLLHPELRLGPGDRIGVTGPNGAGKSTLIRALLGAVTIPRDRVIYLPQEMSEAQTRELAADVARLDRAERGRLMTVVAGLGSEPARLVATSLPSPGEARKLLLALGVLRDPWLIVMDEPTNHLDLPSVELLEKSLADCPCALVLVSHDTRFLDALGCAPWRVAREGNTCRLVV